MDSPLTQSALDLVEDESVFAVPVPDQGPSWLTIILAAVATGWIIYATWSGILFGGGA